MAAHTTNDYKNEKRRQSRTLIREGMFISDYVNTKYNWIYQEASVLYNEINQKNPQKPDLRRTREYRLWKNSFASSGHIPVTPIPREKKRKMVHVAHRDIPISTTTSRPTIISVDLPVIENPATEIPLPDDQSSSPEKPPQDNPILGMTMQLSIPLMPCPTVTKTVQVPKEIPGTDYVETTIDEGNQAETFNPSPDVVPKEIPGTDYVETTIDEGNQAETFNPSLIDEVSPDVMEKIISDLQNDPHLKDMMDHVESQINLEEEIVGLDIDVQDLYDPLEEELSNIIW